MSHVLSYQSGVLTSGLSDVLMVAMAQAEVRCNQMQCPAKILDSRTYVIVADVKLSDKPGHYTAVKIDPP